jgi:hypothetical protein
MTCVRFSEVRRDTLKTYFSITCGISVFLVTCTVSTVCLMNKIKGKMLEAGNVVHLTIVSKNNRLNSHVVRQTYGMEP